MERKDLLLLLLLLPQLLLILLLLLLPPSPSPLSLNPFYRVFTMNITKIGKAHFQSSDDTNLEIVHDSISGYFYPNYSQWAVQFSSVCHNCFVSGGNPGVQSFAFKLVSTITSLDLQSCEQSLKQYYNNVLFLQLITWRRQKCPHRKSVIDPMFSISYKMDSVQHTVMPNSRLRMFLPLGRGLPATISTRQRRRRRMLVVIMMMMI